MFIEESRRAFNEAAAGTDAACATTCRDLAQVERRITGILAAIEDGMYQPSMKGRTAELGGEKHRLTALLEDCPERPALRLHLSRVDLYRGKIGGLAAALQDPDLKAEATATLRDLISELRMISDLDAPNGHLLELVGDLAGILSLAASGEAETTKPPRSAGSGLRHRSETVVAGAGFANCFRMFQATIPPSLAKAA